MRTLIATLIIVALVAMACGSDAETAPNSVAATPTTAEITTSTPEPTVVEETNICDAYFNDGKDLLESEYKRIAKAFGIRGPKIEWDDETKQVIETTELGLSETDGQHSFSPTACIVMMNEIPHDDPDDWVRQTVRIYTGLNHNGAERLFVSPWREGVFQPIYDSKLPN